MRFRESFALAWDKRALAHAVAAATAGAVFTALAAQIAVPLPWTPVPITLQVFAVLVCASALGPRLAAASMAEYLLLGAAGVPVFAGLRGGVGALLGPTGGYLVAFVPAAAAVGWLCRRGGLVRTVLGCAVGVCIIHAAGVAWLKIYLGQTWTAAFLAGSLPFLVPDALKVLAATALIEAGSRKGFA